MKHTKRLVVTLFSMLTALVAGIPVAQATTIAHWDFNSVTAADGAFMPGNGVRADLDGDGVMDSDDFVISAFDLSGNGNHLTVWTSEWMKWSLDSIQGDFSMQYFNPCTAASTDSSFNPGITGTDAETITPSQWTVEALFKLERLDRFCTVVGRDGRFPDNAAAFYLTVRGTDLAVEYRDVDQAVHTLQVPVSMKPNVWYSVAAVSDGTILSLYLNGKVIGLLDLTETGTDTTLAKGDGTWSVARGMWNGEHIDRFFGTIDEVAISDTALRPSTFVIPQISVGPDSDQDGMSNDYENLFKLDANNSSDAQEDPDADSLANFAESILNTDPHAADTDADGQNDDVDYAPLSRAVMWWGRSDLINSDIYDYTGPDWWIGSGKFGGICTNDSWMVPSGEHGQLYIDIDRSLVVSNLMLNLFHQDVADCQVYLDLGDGETVVAENLYGDIADGDGSQDLSRFMLPLAAYPTASRIIIDATANAEPYTVWATTLYVDDDADGLDALQEVQFHTLDSNADTDGDSLADYTEIMVEGTDPINPDTDHDGYSDAEELYGLGSSPFVPMWKEGGMPGVLQVERWFNSEGITIGSLAADWHFGAMADDCILVNTTEYAPETLSHADQYGIRMRGTITAPATGEYTFQLTGDDAAQVWFSTDASPYNRSLLLDLKAWTGFRNLESVRSPSAKVELTAGDAYYFEILMKEHDRDEHASLWWTLPGSTIPEIIGSNYLYSYVAPVDDEDADGLPDAWEEATGLAPDLANGGGLRDADGDSYSDFEEYFYDLDPTVPDEDTDGLSGGDEITVTLTDPLKADTDDDGIPDLTTALTIKGSDYVDCRETHFAATWSSDGTNAILKEANAAPWVIYNLSVTNAGMYRLAIDASNLYTYTAGIHAREIRLLVEIDGTVIDELWMNHTPALPTYTCFTPWLSTGNHTLKLSVLTTWWSTGPFQIHGIELGAINGVDSNGDGIQNWEQAILDKGLDSDGDGLSDMDEILVYGTGVLSSDSDHDGLTDKEELSFYGSDPLNPDSDGDGVIDGVEAKETLTDLLSSEFDGSSVTVLTVPGVQTNVAAGKWNAEGTEIVSKDRRGYLEYTMDFPAQDLYCLNINAAHLWEKISCSPAEPVEESAFLVYVDGIFVGEYPMVGADGIYEDVRAFLPVLPAGEHTVRLFWDNVHVRLAVQIKELKLLTLGGPDEDGNGVKDWVEASLNAMAGVDGISQSYVSPACIEGDARYVGLMAVSGGITNPPAAMQSAGERWYADLPLFEDGTTHAMASFQNGALEVPFSIDWTPYNIIAHNGETLYIRKGDSVKFVALPVDANGGQFELGYELEVGGTVENSPNTQPLVRTFPDAGTFVVNGTYTHGNDVVAGSVTVAVLDGSFPEENPACLVGKQREWTFEGMPAGVSYETDASVEMVVQSVPSTNNQHSTTVSFEAHDANGTHMMVARTSPGGPILDAVKLSSCWIQNAADGYFWTIDSFEDSELWEVESIEQNLPPTVNLRIKVIVGGVMLDDYTLERWVTNADYDGTGVYRFRLLHPNNVATSVCHTFMTYQNGQFIGEIFGGE